MDPVVAAIEEAAFEAWPAAEVVTLGGWRLRSNRGVTNRGNSAWCVPGTSTSESDALSLVAAVESFYRERDRPALFQLTPLSDPAFEPLLERRGYEKFSPVDVQCAEVERIAECAPSAADAGCDDQPSADWVELSTTRGRYPGERATTFMAMMRRLQGRAGFAWARGDRGVAAVGLTVLSPPWAGIFAMRTDEEARGRGLGGAVLGELARWAQERGARELYLQVEPDNPAAHGLYQRNHFATRYRYHYRRQVMTTRV